MPMPTMLATTMQVAVKSETERTSAGLPEDTGKQYGRGMGKSKAQAHCRGARLVHHRRSMNDSLRRFEVLLPLNFNDGQPVPRQLLDLTRHEFKERFGAISTETQSIRGSDRGTDSEGDKLVRIFLDVPDSPENRAFFSEAKERLKTRFEQEEIWITTHVIERL